MPLVRPTRATGGRGDDEAVGEEWVCPATRARYVEREGKLTPLGEAATAPTGRGNERDKEKQ